MKTLIENYNFDASQRKVTFLCDDIVTLENLLLITNLTKNQVIYVCGTKRLGGSIVDNVLTLELNTNNMSNTDVLQVYYEKDTDYDKLNAILEKGLIEIARQLQNIKSNNPLPDMAGRNRVVVESGSVGINAGQTLGTVTTVGTVTGIGNYNASMMVSNTSNLAPNNLRNKITVS